MALPTDLDHLRSGGKSALAQAFAELEKSGETDRAVRLVSEAWANPIGHVIGLTGPPGVGKSSLADVLMKHWRGSEVSVGAIVVDPSSKISGGALLGDRTRIKTDPEDQHVFVRSMAARDRLGGLSSLTAAAATLMRAVFDIVLIETVGVGQSETDIAHTADTVVFCVQPGSGDALQFMKAGIMEVPHIIAVTKMDLGAAARRAVSDVSDAIGLAQHDQSGWSTEIVGVSTQDEESVSNLVTLLDKRWSWLAAGQRGSQVRLKNDATYVENTLRERFGTNGLALAREVLKIEDLRSRSPFEQVSMVSQRVTIDVRGP